MAEKKKKVSKRDFNPYEGNIVFDYGGRTEKEIKRYFANALLKTCIQLSDRGEFPVKNLRDYNLRVVDD